MNKEQMRIKIAELCGWKRGRTGNWSPPGTSDDNWPYSSIPEYSTDLNAIAAAEKKLDSLSPDERSKWLDHLAICCNWPRRFTAADLRFEVQYLSARATAEQRARAFIAFHIS